MRGPNDTPAGRGPRPAYSPRKTLLGTALLAGVALLLVLAVSYPVLAGVAATTAVATRYLPRLLVLLHRELRTDAPAGARSADA